MLSDFQPSAFWISKSLYSFVPHSYIERSLEIVLLKVFQSSCRTINFSLFCASVLPCLFSSCTPTFLKLSLLRTYKQHLWSCLLSAPCFPLPRTTWDNKVSVFVEQVFKWMNNKEANMLSGMTRAVSWSPIYIKKKKKVLMQLILAKNKAIIRN